MVVVEVSRRECPKLELAVEGNSNPVRQTAAPEVRISSAALGLRPRAGGLWREQTCSSENLAYPVARGLRLGLLNYFLLHFDLPAFLKCLILLSRTQKCFYCLDFWDRKVYNCIRHIMRLLWLWSNNRFLILSPVCLTKYDLSWSFKVDLNFLSRKKSQKLNREFRY